MRRLDAPYRTTNLCPWPARQGLYCYRVLPTGADADRYPFKGLGEHEVVVWMPDDPLGATETRDWSFVTDFRHLEQVTV